MRKAPNYCPQNLDQHFGSKLIQFVFVWFTTDRKYGILLEDVQLVYFLS